MMSASLKMKMPLLIKNDADSELRAIIPFLSAKDVKAVEIYWQVSELYGQHFMSD